MNFEVVYFKPFVSTYEALLSYNPEGHRIYGELGASTDVTMFSAP
jgi:hypothetical protein